MIQYLHGTVTDIDIGSIVIETGGVGFAVLIPQGRCGGDYEMGEEATVWTYLSVTQDGMTLYGLPSRDALILFRMLLGVSGIGPKAALSILASLTVDELRFALASGDAAAIARAQGVGKKTAEKAILELRDKIGNVFPDAPAIDATPEETGNESLAVREAIEALVSLGYTGQEARRAVRRAASHAADDVESILHAALREL
ncbi:MAG: Holliday junction branch migration protein RuvA [Lachnospiraceae bacterium]|nr:Holliday junction branch migration protein RuvA [Lachnospiraceae bacterium]MBQ6546002.1 Holliday junction branch migration protein RuvA [Lachnospiraceae bacterium]